MKNIKTNSPAFPVYDHHGNGQEFLADAGITIRGYFAAKAMQAAITAVGSWGPMQFKDLDVKEAANFAWRMANAMLEDYE